MKLFHQFPGEIISPQRRNRQIHVVFLAVRKHLIHQFFQAPVVRGRKTGNGNLLISGKLQCLHGLPVEHLGAFLAHRAAAESRLTEPASSDTSPEGLQIGPVVDNLRGGYNHLCWEISLVQVFHNPLGNGLRSSLQGDDRGKCAIGIVFMPVEAGDIDTGNFRHSVKEPVLVPALRLGLIVQRDNLYRDFLSFSQREKVYKLCQRLRIKGADAPRKDHVFQILPVFCPERNPRQVQHIQHIGIGHFIADGKGNHVKILHRVLTFQRPQRQILLPHYFLHIRPRCKYPFAPDAFHLVHHTIENPHSHIGHADLIGIREAKGNPHPDILQVLLHLAPFSAGIPGRLLNRQENSL